MEQAYDYLIGVDGGGTKTLVRVVRADGSLLAEAVGPGSALRNGAMAAWDAILTTLQKAFSIAGVAMPPLSGVAAGIGIAGFNVAQWAEDFRAQAPAFGALQLANDATTTLLGAHQGQAGAVIAVGTGTIGVALYADGSQRVVDGWGFPSGDDASGAWMGLRAINHVQHVVDGRAPHGALSAATVAFCETDGATNTPGRAERDIVLDWLSQADQAAFARLARLVIAHADDDPAARNILMQAAAELELMADTLDPDKQLPLALCGGLAGALQNYFSPALQLRITPALADSADGALLLVRKSLTFS
ncbi:putative N-acetylglucosamine kinase [Herbaspirillum sp. CF444]|uniref:BadF/BadG/BcrA/BcrD ATPase family protein n=1 Tax=Herbaspirillum sp. CF444 TaxID=1144319 RepID=UPI00027263BC|nr:BadF/BadG/BcrA/BcrD ATPase family protein [Herbaspirillum sp. CF444]EJL82641.1 putative N-acetylglucosamine kinase [Herbaspirillum sp. CF444]